MAGLGAALGAAALGGAALDLSTVSVPFASAALFAAELPALQLCDRGLDDAACPLRPEHGGAGFLSAVFTWRYALNNLRGSLLAAAATGQAAPQGSLEASLQLLGALDQVMAAPTAELFFDVVQAARGAFQQLRPFLAAQAPLLARLPPAPAGYAPPRWTWPSDGRTSLGGAAFTLRTGKQMPAVAFGTWRLWAKEAYQPVRWALELGYRHIDTAEGYANEAEIGRALRDSGVPRSEVFLATKASSIPRGLADISLAEEIFREQLRQLGTDYVDLYMLHSVPQNRQEMMALWRVLERLFDSGQARALGVSNCDAGELRALLAEARVPPAYLQNLYKIYKPGEQLPADEDTVLLAQANRIAVMGYSGQTDWPHVLPPLLDPHVLSVAARHGRTASQVLHRWALQRGVGVLPKSARRERIAENARLFDFELDEASMRLLDGLATLSESGAVAPTKPRHLEDVYGLSSVSQPATPAAVAWTQEEVAVPREALDRGFEFRAVQAYLLGPAENVSPAACRQRCLQRPECRGWEVCAPYDAAQGCEGCYLVGAAPGLATVQVAGWYGAVERS